MLIISFLSKKVQHGISRLILNVAEKNESAKMIAKLLSNNKAIMTEGHSKYNKLYNFEYIINQSVNRMIMTSVSGHLMDLEFPPRTKNWKTTDPMTLFNTPVTKSCSKNSLLIKQTLEEIVETCQVLIIWTDCDREGENIGKEIADVCLAVNSKLQVKRARFSEITSQSVTRAIQSLVELDVKTCQAVDVRQELDLKTGAAFSRLQTIYLTNKFPTILLGKIISYGSCQFPTLGFVVERYKSVANFISQPFWKIVLTHEKDQILNEFHWKQVRSFDEQLVKKSMEKITSNGSIACVTDVINKPTYKKRPVALNTIEMEKLASQNLQISPKATMQIAEKLYSQGYISYPRTDTNIFPSEINLHNLVQAQVSDIRWGDFAKNLLKKISPHNGKRTDKAHPPIYPLKLGLNLEKDDARIYELITRHFLACLSNDSKAHQTEVTIDCISKDHSVDHWKSIDEQLKPSGLGEEFILSGLRIVEKNYLVVYPYENWVDKMISVYEKGEIFDPALSIKKSKTIPPSLITDAELISLMDKHGIGTDATHAEHVDKIKTREYVCYKDKKSKYLLPCKLGMGLVDGYNSIGIDLVRPSLRSKFEEDLKKICEGLCEPNEVLIRYLNEYQSIFRETVANINKLENSVGQYLSCGNLAEIEMPTKFSSDMLQTSNICSTESSMSVKNIPNCNCGEPAVIKTINNQLFYTCKTLKCKFSQLDNFNSKNINLEENKKKSTSIAENENHDHIKCYCGKDVKIKIVTKNNINKGRKFYSCGQNHGCAFFKWCSDETVSTVHGVLSSQNHIDSLT